MTLAETTQKVSVLAKNKPGVLGKKVKFNFEEGCIFLDDSENPTRVTNTGEYADCVIKVSLSNFNKLMDGELNPMGAYMMGKIKIEGEMNVAMKLSNLF